jgi:hypothetical protein
MEITSYSPAPAGSAPFFRALVVYSYQVLYEKGRVVQAGLRNDAVKLLFVLVAQKAYASLRRPIYSASSKDQLGTG